MVDTISIGTAIAILGCAFSAWAFVVAWGVGVIRKEVKDLKHEITKTGTTQIAHINQTERRLTMLETEFRFIRRRMGVVEATDYNLNE